MLGPDVTETQDEEQFNAEAADYSPPNEDQGEETQDDTYEDRVRGGITGVMDEEDEGSTS
jgi:hypothetical protein